MGLGASGSLVLREVLAWLGRRGRRVPREWLVWVLPERSGTRVQLAPQDRRD